MHLSHPSEPARREIIHRSPAQPVAVIRGTGLLTPLGAGGAETWGPLVGGRFLTATGIVQHPALRSTQRAATLAFLAAEAAGRAIPTAELEAFDTALVVGTSKGPSDDWLAAACNAPDAIASRNQTAGRRQLEGVGEIACQVASALGIAGPRVTVSGACASGLHALIRGTMLIESGQARRVLVVAAESSLHPLFMACYQRLGVLAPLETGCRPFDAGRRGFFVSEAAAALLLEADIVTDTASRAAADTSSRAPRIFIERYAMGSDATHITGSDPDARTLRQLLAKVVAGQTVDLIHAHGTGTSTNDPIELAAIESVLGGPGQLQPSLYSHKGAIGHTLGASGLIAVVLNYMAHRDGMVPPSPQVSDPLPMHAVSISREITPRPIHRSIAMASGFGGATAVVGLRKA